MLGTDPSASAPVLPTSPQGGCEVVVRVVRDVGAPSTSTPSGPCWWRWCSKSVVIGWWWSTTTTLMKWWQSRKGCHPLCGTLGAMVPPCKEDDEACLGCDQDDVRRLWSHPQGECPATKDGVWMISCDGESIVDFALCLSLGSPTNRRSLMIWLPTRLWPSTCVWFCPSSRRLHSIETLLDILTLSIEEVMGRLWAVEEPAMQYVG